MIRTAALLVLGISPLAQVQVGPGIPSSPGEYYTMTGALAVAVLVLWRALEKSQRRNETMLKEMLEHAGILRDAAGAIDRMRTDTHAELRAIREDTQAAVRSCELWRSSLAHGAAAGGHRREE